MCPLLQALSQQYRSMFGKDKGNKDDDPDNVGKQVNIQPADDEGLGMRWMQAVAWVSDMNWTVVANIRPRHHGHKALITYIDCVKSQ